MSKLTKDLPTFPLFTRRSALLGASGLALGATLVGCSSGQGSVKGKKILVIGAGSSGLAAATELTAAGAEVTILEARDRIGGRAYSVPFGSGEANLGASWIHGISGNPITELAEAAGAKLVPTDYDAYKLYGDKEFGNLETEWGKWESKLTSALTLAQDAPSDMSILEAVNQFADFSSLPIIEQSGIRLVINDLYEQEYSGDANQLSSWYGDEGKEFPGGDVLVSSGYTSVFTPIAEKLEVLLGQQVTRVSDTSKGVKVETTKGDFEADHAVITVPLAVLVSGDSDFSASIPDETLAAAGRLGTGCLSKTILRFDTPFWEPGVDWNVEITKTPVEWAEWMTPSASGADFMVGFNAGDFGTAVEALPEDEAVSLAMEALRRMYGNSIPDPVEVARSQWTLDPLAQGSYSFIPVGGSPEDRAALAEPFSETVTLAGEATSVDFPSTVHGAWLSGIRAAGQIVGE